MEKQNNQSVVNKQSDLIKDRVLKIANYFKVHGGTTRELASIFRISNKTVYIDLYQRLPQLDPRLYEEIKSQLTLTDEVKHYKTITKRILMATELVIEGHTIEEIVQILDSTYDVIYDDLKVRLPKLDSEMSLIVEQKLGQNSLNNLPNLKNQ